MVSTTQEAQRQAPTNTTRQEPRSAHAPNRALIERFEAVLHEAQHEARLPNAGVSQQNYLDLAGA